ncbi:ceramidase domain-containing protein [Bosea sp. CCNWLW174]|uniref:ceramidase domain-containing protein n=1 Tax=unclassified Bosea (in: a-proteobacteria) TaxID=2653178 RepID=UPI003014A6FE
MQGAGYCERLGGAFWAEPLNAISNAAFLLAALAAFLMLRRQGHRDRPVEALTILVGIIGVGSFLFHTMPQRWTLLADVVPIQLFALCYFGLALNRFLGLSPLLAAIGALLFLGACFGLASGVAPLLPAGMRGSAGYAGFLIGLFGVALAARGRGDAATGGRMAVASLVFALSLSFRSLDSVLCSAVPFGLHWGWHLLNGLLLYLLLHAALLSPRS